VTSSFEIKVCFSRKRQDVSASNFFQGLGENTFITTCIEKGCTRPLKHLKSYIQFINP